MNHRVDTPEQLKAVLRGLRRARGLNGKLGRSGGVFGDREARPIVRAIVTSMVSPGLSSLAIGAMPARQTIQPV